MYIVVSSLYVVNSVLQQDLLFPPYIFFFLVTCWWGGPIPKFKGCVGSCLIQKRVAFFRQVAIMLTSYVFTRWLSCGTKLSPITKEQTRTCWRLNCILFFFSSLSSLVLLIYEKISGSLFYIKAEPYLKNSQLLQISSKNQARGTAFFKQQSWKT